MGREPEYRHAQAEDGEAGENEKAAVALHWKAREYGRGEQRPNGRRRAQDAGAPGADVEDVAREDRDQRGHAAEQGGDQVERHGAEHRLAAPDEAEAGDERMPAQLGPLGRDRRTR